MTANFQTRSRKQNALLCNKGHYSCKVLLPIETSPILMHVEKQTAYMYRPITLSHVSWIAKNKKKKKKKKKEKRNKKNYIKTKNLFLAQDSLKVCLVDTCWFWQILGQHHYCWRFMKRGFSHMPSGTLLLSLADNIIIPMRFESIGMGSSRPDPQSQWSSPFFLVPCLGHYLLLCMLHHGPPTVGHLSKP